MGNINIITNNKPRQLIYGYELTDKQKQDFDYIDDIDSHDFVKYKNNIYDLSEFMRVENKNNHRLNCNVLKLIGHQTAY